MAFRRFASCAVLAAPLAWIACSSFSGETPTTPDGGLPEASVPDAPDSSTAEATVTLFDDGDNWSTFNLATVANSSWTGAALAGHYIYLSPGQSTAVRYDIDAPFSAVTSWTKFDVATLPEPGGPGTAPVYDGKWVYFAPFFNTGAGVPVPSVAYRYDTAAPFDTATSWQAFNQDQIRPGGIAPTSATVFDGSRVSTLGYPKAAADGGTKPVFHLTFATTGEFSNSASWTATAAASLDAGADEFVGGVVVNGQLYSASITTSRLFRSTPTFAEPIVADLTSVVGNAFGGSYGLATDGRYVYLVPLLASYTLTGAKIVRYDTTLPMSEKSSFAVFDSTVLGQDVKAFSGAIFDGRYVYMPPYKGTRFLRYDTTLPFADASSYSTFDISRITDPAVAVALRNGGVFDGQYVYFIPNTGGLVARFKARTRRVPTTPQASSF